MPNKNQLKEAGVYSGLKYAVMKKKWWPMSKAAGHIVCTLMKQKTDRRCGQFTVPKAPIPTLQSPLPPVRLFLLKLQPSQTMPSSANQLFQSGSLQKTLHIQKHNINMFQVPKGTHDKTKYLLDSRMHYLIL